jgi:hypothetical protein
MKTVATVFWMILMFIASAEAQTMVIGPNNRETAFGTDPVIRVNSLFRTQVTLKEGQTVPDGTALETARRELYQMAEGECQTLSQVPSQCRHDQWCAAGPEPAAAEHGDRERQLRIARQEPRAIARIWGARQPTPIWCRLRNAISSGGRREIRTPDPLGVNEML